MRKVRVLAAATAIAILGAGQAVAGDDVMVVFDGSNSMWGQIDGVAKITIAREAMNHLFSEWPEGTNVGLMAYGHRRQGDCNDIETMIAPGPFDRADFMARVGSISPKGKTPLTSAVEQAAEALAYRDNPATVVLITDGIESCRRDPCALAGELERRGVDFTAHVVGFDLESADQEAVACMAERTGGRFVAAADADELGAALGEVGLALAEAPALQPEPDPGSEPEPATNAPLASATLEGPESAVAGSSFSISWEASEQTPRDYVTIAPMGAPESENGDYIRVRDAREGILRAPADAGLYELRYVLQEGPRVVASAEIEIVEAEASVQAPESAVAGSDFPVQWSSAIHPRDYVTIVPLGADEGSHGDYGRVGNNSEATLRAPAEPGLYEVRYVLQEGSRTLASSEIEIVAAEASVQAPGSAVIGSAFPVQWSSSIHPRDFVTIVPLGADEGSHGDYARVGDSSEASLRAPAEAGLYEVRYVLQEGRRTLASAEIEIVEADIELIGPERVRAGSEIRMTWSGTPPHPRDYITLVPMGAEQGVSGNYVRVGNRAEAALEASVETGLYEVRYVLDQSSRTLASHMVEVVGEHAALNDGGVLEAPETGAPGATVEVRWTSEKADNDQRITLAAADQANFTWISAQSAGDGPLTFTLPEAPGFYEFRLLDITDRKVLSRVVIRVE